MKLIDGSSFSRGERIGKLAYDWPIVTLTAPHFLLSKREYQTDESIINLFFCAFLSSSLSTNSCLAQYDIVRAVSARFYIGLSAESTSV